MVLSIFACGREGASRGLEQRELVGRTLSEPLPKVAFTLTSMDGTPYDFLEETEGFVTLLFFGYTYCPDVCPIHMASISSVLSQMSPAQADGFKVVFVTTDPERDTPKRLQEWLGNFHRDFVGLTGSLDQVTQIQQAIGLGPSYKEELPDGGYGMAHAAQVIAYTRDNLAHVVYPFGTRQVDWDHDLPLLAGM